MIEIGARVEAIAIPGLPIIKPGDDLASMIAAAVERAELRLRAGDIIAVASKLVSRAEGRFVDLASVEPSPRARELAAVTGKDARHVEVVLRESTAVSRATRGVLIVRHRLGFVVANAGVDLSNADGRMLLLPADPDATAARLRSVLRASAVVITDSFGRPFRLGTVGVAIGVAGLPPLWDQRGRDDLGGRPLESTFTAVADQVAALADLVAGQAAEGRGVVVVRGLRFDPDERGAGTLDRAPEEDLYA